MTHKVDNYIREIDEVGYTTIKKAFTEPQMDRALELLKQWYEKSQESLADNVPFLNRDQPMVYNLQNKDRYFLELMLGSEQLEQILIHFLNDEWFKQIPPGQPNYILRSLLGRSSRHPLPLHIDSFIPYLGSFVTTMQAVIVLESMSPENGCTLVIPGSHKAGCYVDQEKIKDAIPVTAERGDVVIWDSRLWHGATENKTEGTRWAIIATFIRWWIKQAFEITQGLPREIYDQSTDKEKAILGFCSVPYLNESQGIDMKRGYDNMAEPKAPMSV